MKSPVAISNYCITHLLLFAVFLVDTILETLKQHSTIRSNMRVISNQMLFDESGIACGFSEPVIHSYSKGKSPEQFSSVQDWIEVSLPQQ